MKNSSTDVGNYESIGFTIQATFQRMKLKNRYHKLSVITIIITLAV